MENTQVVNINRKLIGLLLSAVTLIVGLQNSATSEPITQNRPEKATPPANPGKNNRAPIRLPGNKHIPISKFLGREHYQSKLSKELGAELKSFELITFREYLNKYSPGTEVVEISDDRIVAVLQIYYPNKFTAYNGIEYLSATSTSIRDGLTGEVIGYEFEGQLANPEVFNSIVIEQN